MATDRDTMRTDGETMGREQLPVDAGEHDATQREQERREGWPPIQDPTAPNAKREDSLMARSPDEIYGREEGESGTSRAGMPVTGSEDLPPVPE